MSKMSSEQTGRSTTGNKTDKLIFFNLPCDFRLEKALVAPTFKKSSQTCCENCRGIAYLIQHIKCIPTLLTTR